MGKPFFKLFIAFCLILMARTLVAQDYDYDYDYNYDQNDQDTQPLKKDHKFDKSKLSIGGFGGFGFSSDYIYLDLSPNVAYRVIEKMQVGVGITYKYQNLGDYYQPPFDEFNKMHFYGGQVFDRFFVWKNLFAQLEYDVLNTKSYVERKEVYTHATLPVITRKTFHTVFAGGGYNVPLGTNSYLSLMLLINLNKNDLYTARDQNGNLHQIRQPQFSLGFGIGL